MPIIKVHANLLKKIPYFADLDQKRLSEICEKTVITEYLSDQIIFTEGEIADAFYFIIEGEIQIYTYDYKDEKIILARFQKEEFFGEQAFSESAFPRRTATAKALTHSTLYRIPRDDLKRLRSENINLMQLIDAKFSHYLQDKLIKLTASINHPQQISYFLENASSYEVREIICFQNDPANNLFIVLQGEIELRNYDENNNPISQIKLHPGEVFGNESIDEANYYRSTAVATQNSRVVTIPRVILQEYFDKIPFLFDYGKKLTRQRDFGKHGKALQFRGEYLEHPTFVSILLLKDHREIICQQAIDTQLVIVKTIGIEPDQIYHYKTSNYQRELQLYGKQIVGFVDIGFWEDTDQLVQLIVQRHPIENSNIQDFQETGNINFSTQSTELNKNLVCLCMRVSKHTIENCIKRGCNTFECVRDETGASTVCGSCRPAIMEMLGNSVWIPCHVSQLISHNDKISTFRFEPILPTQIKFIPGQHIIIKAGIAPYWIHRSYTLTSLNETNAYEVTIKREDQGKFSSWLYDNITQHPLIYVSGPYGEFKLIEDKPIICFAGGVGITPFVSFCMYLLKYNRNCPIYVDYSLRNMQDMVFNNVFAETLRDMPNAQIKFRITSESGRISEQETIDIIASLPHAEIYICGPEDFKDSLVMVLQKIGITADRIHIERFVHASALPDMPQTITF